VLWVASERTIPILPCRHLDDVLPFYSALGFEQTYRQVRPNPYLCLRRGGIDLHFSGVEAFDPAHSLGNVIVVVPDAGALYDAFAAGLRAVYGKLPVAGIPRITRPRRKQGTVAGFSVVDPGGNWLRVSSSGDDEEDAAPVGHLERVLRAAARQGDARGEESVAIAVLDAGLARHTDAPAAERVGVLVYLAELLVRIGDRDRAVATLAEIRALDLDEAVRAARASELATAAEIERELG
jgi:catechol 2,3-dioxygenase-like lactoylglutathione lyase family enzyme